MNLFRELNKAGFSWSVGPGEREGAVSMTMKLPEGDPVSREVNPFALAKGRDALTALAVKCLRAMDPKPEILTRWYDSHGNFRARIIPGHGGTAAELYYSTHVALRKLLDGPESVILWNGYHSLDEETRNLYMEFLKTGFEPVFARKEQTVDNLHTFSTSFKDDVVAFFDDRANSHMQGSRITEDQRQIHRTLLYSMANAFKNMSGEDYVYGFFGYIFERFPGD